MNLVISKGEIVAYEWGNDRITTATIEVPAAPSTPLAREYERQYLDLQGPEMAKPIPEDPRPHSRPTLGFRSAAVEWVLRQAQHEREQARLVANRSP